MVRFFLQVIGVLLAGCGAVNEPQTESRRLLGVSAEANTQSANIETLPDAGQIVATILPEGMPSLADQWSKLVEPVVKQRCEVCHSGMSSPQLLSVNVWLQDLSEQLALDPESRGRILARMTSTGLDVMPPSGALEGSEAESVQNWVELARTELITDRNRSSTNRIEGNSPQSEVMPDTLVGPEYWLTRTTLAALSEDFEATVGPFVSQSCSNCHSERSSSPYSTFARWLRNIRNECLGNSDNCVIERLAEQRIGTPVTMPPAYDATSVGMFTLAKRRNVLLFAEQLKRVVVSESVTSQSSGLAASAVSSGPAPILLDGLALKKAFEIGLGVTLGNRSILLNQAELGIFSLRSETDLGFGVQITVADSISQDYLNALRELANTACSTLVASELAAAQQGDLSPRKLIQVLDIPTAAHINSFMEYAYRAPAKVGSLHPGALEIYKKLAELKDSGERYYLQQLYTHVCLAVTTSPPMFMR